MESEVAAAIVSDWQAVGVIIAVVVLAVGAFSLVSFWVGRHIDAMFGKQSTAIDAKFDKHTAAMDAKFDKHTAAMDAKFDKHTAAMDAKFDKHTAAMDAKFDKHTAATDAKFDAIDAKFDALEAKFDKHAAVVEVRLDHVEAAIARGAKEHEDWRVEMKAINEKVTDLVIDREVERRMQASRGGAGSDVA